MMESQHCDICHKKNRKMGLRNTITRAATEQPVSLGGFLGAICFSESGRAFGFSFVFFDDYYACLLVETASTLSVFPPWKSGKEK